MRALGRIVVLLFAALGGLVGSQFPDFAQQYRQRLGGALDEMKAVVADFDADARRNQLDRDTALKTYERSDQPFLRDRGTTMTGALARYDRLFRQKVRLEAAPPLMRPVVMLSGPDERVASGAWTDFEPGVPLTPAGLVWAGLGFFLLGGAVSLVRQLFGVARRRRRGAVLNNG